MSPIEGALVGAGARGLNGVFGFFSRLWRSRRFRGRVELALDWDRPKLWVSGMPFESWRALRIRIIAPRDSEFVVADGTLEARPKGARKWRVVSPLENLVRLPVTVPANRDWITLCAGSSILEVLPTDLRSLQHVELRVIVRDLHRVSLKGDGLAVSLRELALERRED